MIIAAALPAAFPRLAAEGHRTSAGDAGIGLQGGAIDDQPRGDFEDRWQFPTAAFSLSVLPVETRSTICRARPNDGASSIAPFSLTHSACTPAASKWRRVRPGYLVATRKMARARRLVDIRCQPRNRQAAQSDAEIDPARKDRRSRIPQITSEPTIPTCAGAMGDKGGHIESAHADQAHVLAESRQRPARGFWGRGNSASGSIPARAITGSASSRMRPLGTAKGQLSGIVVNTVPWS